MDERRVVRTISLRRSILLGILSAIMTLLIVGGLAILGGDHEDIMDGVLGSIVIGVVLGGPMGALFYRLAGRGRRGETRTLAPAAKRVATPRIKRAARKPHLLDPWAAPVTRCEKSAEAVARLRDSMPASPVSEWLDQIAGTMSAKLAEIHALADAGRAVVPVTNVGSVAAAKKHPLYAVLQRAADEFGEVSTEIGALMLQLHGPLDLEQVKAQLQVLTEQLPLLRPAS
jgi:hypothetical protein